MTSYQQNRDEFLVRMGSYGVSVNDLRKLLRLAETKQRLAVAQCNGDWPYDNGQRETEECSLCAGHWAPSSMRHLKDAGGSRPVLHCPDCRVEAQIRALVASFDVPAYVVQDFGAKPNDGTQGWPLIGTFAECHNFVERNQTRPERYGLLAVSDIDEDLRPEPLITVTLQGDPRGWCVRLVVEGREIGVPVRGR